MASRKSLLLAAAAAHTWLLLQVPGVGAWGTLGHATVAYIAQNYVSEEVATW